MRERLIFITTIVGSVVNAMLTAGKILVGIFGHSSAILADGLHSLSDFVSDIVVLVFVRFSQKGIDEDHDYGHGKFETLATLCISFLLMVVGVELMFSGVRTIWDFYHGTPIETPSIFAFWIAIVSIVSKEILYQYTYRVGERVNSPVLIANAWHHRTDALSSIGSAIGIAGAIFLGENWAVLDPITCCVISIFIVYVALQMAVPSLKELLEVSLPKEMEDEIEATALTVKGVENIHGLKTRQSGPYIIIEAHIVVNPELTVVRAHDISTKVERRWRRKFGKNTQIAIHIEPSEDAE